MFEVDVDGRRVFSKARLDRFPEYQEVPRLEGNVHDLDALSQVSSHLMAAARQL